MVINSISLVFTQTKVLQLFLILPSGCLKSPSQPSGLPRLDYLQEPQHSTSSLLLVLSMKDDGTQVCTKDTASLCSQSLQNHTKPLLLPCAAPETKWHRVVLLCQVPEAGQHLQLCAAPGITNVCNSPSAQAEFCSMCQRWLCSELTLNQVGTKGVLPYLSSNASQRSVEKLLLFLLGFCFYFQIPLRFCFHFQYPSIFESNQTQIPGELV